VARRVKAKHGFTAWAVLVYAFWPPSSSSCRHATTSTLSPALGKGTILLGQVVFNASVAMLIIRARFVGMGDELEEAAYDLGSGPMATSAR
jgi:ABC-type spermidine/putrescine transport system permease subunit II